MRTVKATFGIRVLLKLAGIKLKELDGHFLIPNPREVKRKLGRAIELYKIKIIHF